MNSASLVDSLVNGHLPIARYHARQWAYRFGHNEALSHALAGLLKAAQNWDAASGRPFTLHAHVTTKYHMIDAWRHHTRALSGGSGRRGNSGISHICLDARSEHHALIDARTPRDDIELQDEYAAVSKSIARLSDRQKKFIALHFGFAGEPVTQDLIARMMDITPSRVSQIMHGALQELRKWQGRVNK